MRNLNFFIHTGGNEVERTALADVELPQRTRSYHPIPHGDYADMIEDAVRKYGFQFREQAHALNREGKQYFGMAELYSEQTANESFALVAGWRSSYDKSLNANFVVGSQVFVCDNLAFSGEIQIGRKHTVNIMRDLPTLIIGAVGQTRVMAAQQEQRYERYQIARVKDAVANDAIIRMLQLGVITTSRVEKVVNEYYEPTFDEHLDANGERTTWTLFNAATAALKGTGLATLPRRTIALHGLIDQTADYALAA